MHGDRSPEEKGRGTLAFVREVLLGNPNGIKTQLIRQSRLFQHFTMRGGNERGVDAFETGDAESELHSRCRSG